MPPPDHDVQLQQLYVKLGVRNGWLIGLALALGAWTPQAMTLSTAHARLVYPPLILGLLALLSLGSLAGWLAAKRSSGLWGGLVWLLAAVLMTWTVGHLPYEGHSLTVWLIDRRFWGLPIYSFSPAAQARLMMVGFFIVLLLTILGLLQDYRLQSVRSETESGGRMNSQAWFLLILPLPLVFAVGLVADNLMNSPTRVAHRLVDQAIQIGRTYPGDLFELGMENGINYNAVSGVRDQMSANYSSFIGEVNMGAANTVIVVTHFDNDTWINCRVTADQLFHCYDASLPYQVGFPALLVTGETPEDCRQCTVKVSDEQRNWLLAQSKNWHDSPRVTRLAQWGSYVLMEARSPTDGSGVECLFRDISPVTLDHCREIQAQN